MRPLTPSAHIDTFARDRLPPPREWPVLDLAGLHHPDRLNAAVELLDTTIARWGADRPCLRAGDGTTLTYGQVRERVDRIAHALVDDLGVVPGNRVLLRGPNNPALVLCWLAALKAGAVVVTTMPLLRRHELRTVGRDAAVRLALCDPRFTEDLLAAGVDGLRVVTFGDDTAELEGLARAKPAEFAAVPTAADDVALIAFTSGTSGQPKATAHFHRDVLAIADTFSAHVLRPTPDDVFAGSPPLAFTYGLGGMVVFPLRAGACSVLLERAGPEELFGAVARLGVTVLFTAPTAYRAVLPSIDRHDLRGLRRCVSAGEALPADTWHRFHDATGLRIVDGIGATEMLHIFISAAEDDIRPGATGRPVPGYTAVVVDDDGLPVPDGVPGRLAVRGPTGCRYLADPRQREYVRDGWNITGDTYVRDSDGYFWYQARSDDMIVSAGYNIAAPEVENALLRHPAVAECAVVGAPDPDRGAVVKAYVVPAAGTVPSPGLVGELQDFAKREIAPYKYPRVVEFVDRLPRTGTGKLQRALLPERRTDAARPAVGSGTARAGTA
ncbi:AMP-binding protein [Saccharothrix syringae]|uniref:2-aminobenzoate-CoA ligase n=1 Tax=Saccharothrix syringae TaxID=103733 RepID=A0A5Q0GUW5_SACSY|nr:AMP-binding protein [Saccharothrix syringae]QFZ17798.1 2-aminobenzoate-CoA ligase [Saccharothrix syringae]